MGKGLLQTVAELLAGAHPDVYGAALKGHLKAVYSGSKKECQDYIKEHNISATVVGTSEIGEYMVCTGGKR